MKKLFKIFIILLAFASTAFAQSVNICAIPNPTCTSFVNSDNKAIYQAIIATGTLCPTCTQTVTMSSGTVSVNNQSVVAQYLYNSGTPSLLNDISSNTINHTYALVSSSVTVSGNVATGERVVMFKASSDFVGTIDGIAVDANETITFSADQSGALPQIVYVISAGNLRIRKMK